MYASLFLRSVACLVSFDTGEVRDTCSSQLRYIPAGINVVTENTQYMYVTIHVTLTKFGWSIYIYVINMNIIYIIILAIGIYDVNPFVGICIGC